MTKTVENDSNGIRWNFTTVLEDIDFADDLALLSSTKTHIQKKVDRLNKHSKAIGMKTSIKKTKLMRYNAKDQTPVLTDGKDVEDVDSFTYLGSIVNKTGVAEQDITARVGKARSSFNKFTKVWKSSQYSMRTKTRIFNSNVLTVLLYGSETWRMTKRDEDKLDSFQHKCLRKILKIHWPMKVTNEEVRKRTGSERLSTQIRTRRWTWIGCWSCVKNETRFVTKNCAKLGTRREEKEVVRENHGGEQSKKREVKWGSKRGQRQ